jgi:drug/metabolite transporter (DMT)-like permease
MRRLVAAVLAGLIGVLLLATPALAADKGSKVDRFNPIVPMLVMLAIGGLIFGVAYVLDKRKD